MSSLLWSLFAVFAPLSFVTIGGGMATMADIQRQVVDVHHWMTASQFVDAFAIGRLAPGPGSLMVTLIGWHVAGFWGAMVAMLSLFTPTAVLIYTVAYLWRRHRGARWQRALETGLRPVAAGMILAAGYVLFISLTGGWLAKVLALLSTVVMMRSRINPMLIVGGGAVIMMLAYSIGLVSV